MSDSVVRFVRAAVGPDLCGPSDAELLRRFAATRDAGAFELLVWRHAGMVLATCRAILRDRHLAEDASQAAFLALARQAARVRENPAGWLYRVARRVAVRQRRAVPVRGRSLTVTDGSRLPAAADLTGTARHDADVLHAELAALPDKYRLPVLLCFVEGLSHADAADRLGWPVGTVAGRIARAKDRLRTRLTARGLAPSLAGLAVSGTDRTFAAATSRLGVAFAAGDTAGVAPTVLPLVTGAMRAMTIAKLKLAAGLVAACGALTAGGVWAGGQKPGAGGGGAGIEPPPPAAAAAPPPKVERLKVDPKAPNPGKPEDPKRTADYAARRQSLKNLKQILVAWHNSGDAYGRLPGNIVAQPGRPIPLLSWRVHLLPFLEQGELYKQFKLDEPWHSPANKPLLAKMPAVFRTAFQPADAIHTYYQGFAGPNTVFEPGRPLTHAAIRDGHSNTLAVAEVGPAVPWTQPVDVPYDPATKFPAVVWPFANVLHLGLADGSCHPVNPFITELHLRRLIETDDGFNIPPLSELKPAFPEEAAEDRALAERLVAENMELLIELETLLREQTVLLKQRGATLSPDRLEAMKVGLRQLVEQQRARNRQLKGEPAKR